MKPELLRSFLKQEGINSRVLQNDYINYLGIFSMMDDFTAQYDRYRDYFSLEAMNQKPVFRYLKTYFLLETAKSAFPFANYRGYYINYFIEIFNILSKHNYKDIRFISQLILYYRQTDYVLECQDIMENCKSKDVLTKFEELEANSNLLEVSIMIRNGDLNILKEITRDIKNSYMGEMILKCDRHSLLNKRINDYYLNLLVNYYVEQNSKQAEAYLINHFNQDILPFSNDETFKDYIYHYCDVALKNYGSYIPFECKYVIDYIIGQCVMKKLVDAN